MKRKKGDVRQIQDWVRCEIIKDIDRGVVNPRGNGT